MRLIDAIKLKISLAASAVLEDGKHIFDIIDEQPTIEPERKKGRWIGTEFDGYADGYPVYYEWKCSACGCVVEDEEPTWNFCPNCGAEMRENSE